MSLIKNNEPTIDVWTLDEDERASIPVGTWVYAGSPSTKGVWCGIKQSTGTDVCAWWRGNEEGFEAYVIDLMKYAGTYVEPEITLKDVQQACYKAITLAEKDAKRHYRVIRGRHRITAARDGEKIDDSDIEAPKAKLSQKFIQQCIDELAKLGADTIYFEAGHDGADTVREMADDWYDPWCSMEEVKIWTKEGGLGIDILSIESSI